MQSSKQLLCKVYVLHCGIYILVRDYVSQENTFYIFRVPYKLHFIGIFH
jgi:hypothetical protein